MLTFHNKVSSPHYKHVITAQGVTAPPDHKGPTWLSTQAASRQVECKQTHYKVAAGCLSNVSVRSRPSRKVHGGKKGHLLTRQQHSNSLYLPMLLLALHTTEDTCLHTESLSDTL